MENQVRATGRRKRAVARVRLVDGAGKMTINGREAETYLPSAAMRALAAEPLHAGELTERYDVLVTVTGGGPSGQAGAIRLGLARAIVEEYPELRATLKKAGMLTRDAREKESKKYGLKKARKAPQYSKR
jgi:small subunit ribosomal protein S9